MRQHDQLDQSPGRAAEERGDDEEQDRERQVVLAPEPIGQPGGHRQDDDVGQDVPRGDPGDLVGGGVEVAGHLRQGDVDDGGVQHLHDGRRDQSNQDDPAEVQVRIRPPSPSPRSPPPGCPLGEGGQTRGCPLSWSRPPRCTFAGVAMCCFSFLRLTGCKAGPQAPAPAPGEGPLPSRRRTRRPPEAPAPPDAPLAPAAPPGPPAAAPVPAAAAAGRAADPGRARCIAAARAAGSHAARSARIAARAGGHSPESRSARRRTCRREPLDIPLDELFVWPFTPCGLFMPPELLMPCGPGALALLFCPPESPMPLSACRRRARPCPMRRCRSRSAPALPPPEDWPPPAFRAAVPAAVVLAGGPGTPCRSRRWCQWSPSRTCPGAASGCRRRGRTACPRCRPPA